MKFIKAENAVTTKHAKLGELKLDVEVPACESVEEATTFCGGADAHLSFDNSQFETNAKNGVRAAMRALPDDAVWDDETKEKLRKIARDYAPQAGEREPGKAKKVKAFDNVKALVESGQEFTREQLLELLAAAK